MTEVAGRLERLRASLREACRAAGRPEDTVELLAVSKLQPLEALREAYAAGVRAFGENYAQELRDKSAALADLPGIRWHAIGPLQTNKAKYVARAAHVFHALDRADVAEELSRRRTGAPLEVYLEVNVGGEASKGGVAPAGVPALAERVRHLPGLQLVGLMAMPPLGPDAEESRPHFRKLAELARAEGLAGLSMGTTHDYRVAIEEGATVVRVGTALFGERPAPARAP
jgi:pyridoxal phosphate enzyme (YggS family)